MRTPREIYAAYKILPNLQLHQLRVAAVGKFICDNLKEQVGERIVVLTCLFHDAGNILKFDLSVFPGALEPEGREYWEAVKAEYRAKYGDDEHAATHAIMGELGLPEGVRALMQGIGFSQLDDVAESDSLERKIIQYGDLRVGPHGVLPLRERLDEGRKRYEGTGRNIGASDPERYKTLVESALDIERQLFARTNIKPDDINDASIAPLIEELWEYQVD